MYPDLIPGVTLIENISLSQLLDENELDLDLGLSAGDEYTDVKPLLDSAPVQEISKDELKYELPTLEQLDTTSNLELEKSVVADNIFSQVTDIENKLNSILKRLHEYTGEVELLEDCTALYLNDDEYGDQEGTGGGILHFIYIHLRTPKSRNIIHWVDEDETEFVIRDPDEFARMWGDEKCKKKCEKKNLARCLNYQVTLGKLKRDNERKFKYTLVERKHRTKSEVNPSAPISKCFSKTPSNYNTHMPTSSSCIFNQNRNEEVDIKPKLNSSGHIFPINSYTQITSCNNLKMKNLSSITGNISRTNSTSGNSKLFCKQENEQNFSSNDSMENSAANNNSNSTSPDFLFGNNSTPQRVKKEINITSCYFGSSITLSPPTQDSPMLSSHKGSFDGSSVNNARNFIRQNSNGCSAYSPQSADGNLSSPMNSECGESCNAADQIANLSLNSPSQNLEQTELSRCFQNKRSNDEWADTISVLTRLDPKHANILKWGVLH